MGNPGLVTALQFYQQLLQIDITSRCLANLPEAAGADPPQHSRNDSDDDQVDVPLALRRTDRPPLQPLNRQQQATVYPQPHSTPGAPHCSSSPVAALAAHHVGVAVTGVTGLPQARPAADFDTPVPDDSWVARARLPEHGQAGAGGPADCWGAGAAQQQQQQQQQQHHHHHHNKLQACQPAPQWLDAAASRRWDSSSTMPASGMQQQAQQLHGNTQPPSHFAWQDDGQQQQQQQHYQNELSDEGLSMPRCGVSRSREPMWATAAAAAAAAAACGGAASKPDGNNRNPIGRQHCDMMLQGVSPAAPAAAAAVGGNAPVAVNIHQVTSCVSNTPSRHPIPAGAQPAPCQARRPLLSKLLAADRAAVDDATAEEGTGGRWAWLGSQRRDRQGRAAGSPGYDPSTLQLPPPAVFSQLSEFAQQFWRIKARAMDVVLFVKHGSFYNLFDVDADVGLRVGLNLSGARTPNMWKVGCHKEVFPHWAAKVLALGYSVGRVEELPAGPPHGSSSSSRPKLLTRRLVKVYTPGMAVEGLSGDLHSHGSSETILFVTEQQQQQQHLTGAHNGTNSGQTHLGCCLLDLAAGQLLVGGMSDSLGRNGLVTLLMRHQPAAVMAVRHSLSPATQRVLQLQCHEAEQGQVEGMDSAGAPTAAAALVYLPANFQHHLAAAQQQLHDHVLPAALQQCMHNQPWASAAEKAAATAVLQLERCGLAHELLGVVQVAPLEAHTAAGAAASNAGAPLQLDDRALSVLEVLEGSLGGVDGSLLAALDGTVSGPGRRRLRAWLCRPLSTVGQIEERLDVVDLFKAQPALAQELVGLLQPLPDPEHLLPRFAVALQQLLPALQGFLQRCEHGAHHHQKLQQQQQQQGQGPSVAAAAMSGDGMAVADAGLDPADCSWVAVAKASIQKAIQQLPECLASYVDAVALLQSALLHQLHTDTTTLPLLHRAVLAAAAAAPALAEAAPVFGGLIWNPSSGMPGAAAAAAGGGKGRGRKAAVQQQAPEAGVVAEPGCCSLPGGQHMRLAPGLNPEYDAACQQAAAAAAAAAQALHEEAGWYNTNRPGGAAPHQQQMGSADGVVVVDAADGLLQVPVAAVQQGLPPGHTVCAPPVHALVAPVGYCYVSVARLQQLAAHQAAADNAAMAALAAAVLSAGQLLLSQYSKLQQLTWAVAELDVLAGFAAVTASTQAPPGCTFCRPTFTAASAAAVAAGGGSGQAPELLARGLWHPLLHCSTGSRPPAARGPGAAARAAAVVCNDLHLGGGSGGPPALLLTGANTGGKSTLLRAACLAVIMAQVGCYAPAAALRLAPADAIFTRVGAQDRIMARQSTFMVEMAETAACLAAATPASLIVLDELGHGTSTHDGYALAYAVLQHLAVPTRRQQLPGALGLAPAARLGWQQGHQLQSSAGGPGISRAVAASGGSARPKHDVCVPPRLLFATHYHGLTQEEALRGHTKVCHMAVRVSAGLDQLQPLYQLRPGPAPQGSCGVMVAAAAGLPQGVVERAAQVTQALLERHAVAA